MKHFYISVFIFSAVICLCFSEKVFIENTMNNMESKVNLLYKADIIDDTYMSRVNILKNYYFIKKNMLHIFVNKEHIKEIELNILLLETSAVNNDIESCKEKAVEIINMIEFITANQIAID